MNIFLKFDFLGNLVFNFISDKGDVFGWGNSEYCQIFKETDNIQQINRPVLVKKCQNHGKIIDIATTGSYCVMLNSKF